MRQKLLVAAAAVAGLLTPAHAKPDHAKPDRAQHGKGKRADHAAQAPVGYGVGGCPPGLRSKNAECMPPGQHKKKFNVGQRVPYNFQGLTGYDGLPDDVRHRYGSGLDPRSRYIYDDNYLYRVDPTTMVVSQVLQGLLRP